MSVGGHEVLQLLKPVLDDDEARGQGRLVRVAAGLDHQKPLAVGCNVVRPAGLVGGGPTAPLEQLVARISASLPTPQRKTAFVRFS